MLSELAGVHVSEGDYCLWKSCTFIFSGTKIYVLWSTFLSSNKSVNGSYFVLLYVVLWSACSSFVTFVKSFEKKLILKNL